VVPFRSRLAWLPLALLVLVVAGCGTQPSAAQTSPSATAAGTTATAPAAGTTATAQPLATPVVSSGSVAAVVNGTSVPMSKFHALANIATSQAVQQSQKADPKAITDEVMNQIVSDELVREYAQKHGISVPASAVNAQVNSNLKGLGSKQALDAKLAQLGINENDYRQLIASFLLGAKVENKISPLKTITPKKTTQEVATVRHILIATKPQGKPARTDAQAKALAQQVFAKLQHGASFASLVTKYSDDPGSVPNGGVYKNITQGEMVAQFNQAAFHDPLHHPRIVKTVYGYHIIEVLSRGKKLIPSMTPQQAQQQAQQPQAQVFDAWITKQQKAATIKKIAKVEKA
jgi:foldase protein PrsA